ncbi:hypothetical protein HA402_013649 [Bradysia odoriphaga]|nr:hypothetical protein HA402_013649 [Bradysia odoriphaga]
MSGKMDWSEDTPDADTTTWERESGDSKQEKKSIFLNDGRVINVDEVNQTVEMEHTSIGTNDKAIPPKMPHGADNLYMNRGDALQAKKIGSLKITSTYTNKSRRKRGYSNTYY